MPTLAQKHFSPKQLRPNTLQPENQNLQKCHFVPCMAINLVFEKIKLLRIKSILYNANLTFIKQHFQSRYIF